MFDHGFKQKFKQLPRGSKLVKRKLFSIYSLAAFTLVFALVGSYLLYSSHASNSLGDINNDGAVNIFDLSLLLASYNNNSTTCITSSTYTCDLDGDGKVDIFDLSILLSNYQNHSNPMVLTVGPPIAMGQTPGIYTLDPYTGNLQLVDGENPWVLEASMSPDGRFIVYVSSQTGNRQISIMNSDGSNNRVLTTAGSGTDESFNPSFSPDGSKIAFIRYSPVSSGANNNVYVMNADGSNQTNLTNYPTTGAIPADDYQEFWTDWAPDGSNILFINCCLVGLGISRISPVSGNMILPYITFKAYNGRYSPNGKKVVYTGGDLNNPSPLVNLYAINADGTGLTELFANLFQENPLLHPSKYALPAPAWSPNGTKVAFIYQTAVYTINPDGSGMKSIFHFPGAAVVNSISWN